MAGVADAPWHAGAEPDQPLPLGRPLGRRDIQDRLHHRRSAVAHPQEIGEAPLPVGPVRTQSRLPRSPLRFHQMCLSEIRPIDGLVFRTLAGRYRSSRGAPATGWPRSGGALCLIDSDPRGTQRAGRVRQWLGAVPAARVWAAPHRLPLTAYDATGLAPGSRGGGHIRQWPPQGHRGHRALDWWPPGPTGKRQAPDSRPGPVVWPGGSYAASASSSDSALARRVLRGAGASASGASSGSLRQAVPALGRPDQPRRARRPHDRAAHLPDEAGREGGPGGTAPSRRARAAAARAAAWRLPPTVAR